MVTKKKTTAKKSAPRKLTRKSKNVNPKSFQISPERYPFFTFKVTDQTIYWSMLFIIILLLGVWVINIQISISEILNEIHL